MIQSRVVSGKRKAKLLKARAWYEEKHGITNAPDDDILKAFDKHTSLLVSWNEARNQPVELWSVNRKQKFQGVDLKELEKEEETLIREGKWLPRRDSSNDKSIAEQIWYTRTNKYYRLTGKRRRYEVLTEEEWKHIDEYERDRALFKQFKENNPERENAPPRQGRSKSRKAHLESQSYMWPQSSHASQQLHPPAFQESSSSSYYDHAAMLPAFHQEHTTKEAHSKLDSEPFPHDGSWNFDEIFFQPHLP